MADPGVIEQLVALHIDDKQPALGGWLAVIDDGENGFAFVAHGLITVKCLTKGLFIQLAGQTQLTIEALIPAGICRAAPDADINSRAKTATRVASLCSRALVSSVNISLSPSVNGADIAINPLDSYMQGAEKAQ